MRTHYHRHTCRYCGQKVVCYVDGCDLGTFYTCGLCCRGIMRDLISWLHLPAIAPRLGPQLAAVLQAKLAELARCEAAMGVVTK